MDNLAISSLLPDLIDNYIATRDRRLLLDKQAADLKEQEEDLKKIIISKFREGFITAQGSKNGIVKMKRSVEPVPNDWSLIYDYIQDHDAFDLLHKRLTAVAVKARWDDGVDIPGVGSTEVFTLSVSKS